MTDDEEYALQREIAFLLVDASRKLSDAYDLHMKPLALTRSQWRVMAYVNRTPGISQTQLAQDIQCSRMAITALLDRLEGKGMIERRTAQTDRRMRAVFLTDKGTALVKRMTRAAVGVLGKVFADTTHDERVALHATLETIKHNAMHIAQGEHPRP